MNSDSAPRGSSVEHTRDLRKKWLRRFWYFAAILMLVVTVFVFTYGDRLTAMDRNIRFLIASVGIVALVGSAYNGGLALGFWLMERHGHKGSSSAR
jgi:hypothetical protein